eukprot:TRINITY_DN2263_c0_g1_i1.p1 TRINITY_DN2263_c0_g1~~TRINITY_DN2263_c0_g1_i1.p1  ORF type:complete len:107 (+),score=25.80 TRINITY_DN2263_c0_g1_i1:69-389(+)
MGEQGEFSSSSFTGLEKTLKSPARRKISCAVQGNGTYHVPAAFSVKMMVLSIVFFVSSSLLTINLAIISALPDPPILTPRRGVTRRWRRERFSERNRGFFEMEAIK